VTAHLTLDSLTVRRAERSVLQEVSLRIAPGELVGLLGPNGAGKTSLMRAALGLLAFEGASSLAMLSPSARARAAAWLPQTREIAWGLSVADVVALGRVPHRALGRPPGPEDHAAVERAIERLGLADFRNRPADALSGGEQARVLIARALAQETPLLLADEPVAGLDPAAQIMAMEVFAELAAAGRSVLVSLHDLGLAARHCTRLVMLHGGRLVADGPPGTVLTEAHLARVFQLRAFHAETPLGPVFQPLEVLR